MTSQVAPVRRSAPTPAGPHVAAPDLPDHLPGEPQRRRWSVGAILIEHLRRLLVLLFTAAVTLPLWPPYLVARLFSPRTPNVASTARFRRCLYLILTERPATHPVGPALRISLLLTLFQRWWLSAPLGLAWMLDDLLYGRALRATPIVAPLFEISAPRSGSTQLARYLEDTPQLRAPSVLQSLFPFYWLWRIAPPLLGRVFPPQRAHERFVASLPGPYLQRHEMDLFRTDTFEMIFFAGVILGDLLLCLGPRVYREEWAIGDADAAHRSIWMEDFVDYLDGVGRKTLLYAARAGGPAPRLMVKGHFLRVAPVLERRYPDARFLTVLRAPEATLQSLINYMRCVPVDPLFELVPWSWLRETTLVSVPNYCDAELEFYRRTDGARRCVVRFEDFVQDLEGVLRRVFRECLDLETLPLDLPVTHAGRARTRYSFDRSLEQLGIDVERFNQRLEAYNRWRRELDRTIDRLPVSGPSDAHPEIAAMSPAR